MSNSLTGKKVSQTYQNLVQYIDGIFYDGSGNVVPINSSTASYDTTLDPSLAMLSAVGGIPAGTIVNDLLGDSLVSLFDNLLFPTVNPTYIAPSISFSVAPYALQEVSTNLSLTFTSTFNRGQILVSGSFQDYRSGLPSTYKYTGTGLVDSSSSSLSNVQVIGSYFVNIGNQSSWTNSVIHLIGPQPKDNKNNNYGTPLAAGTIGPSSLTFEGVYPLFGTTASIGIMTKQTLVSMLSGNNIVFSMVAETGGNKQAFEIPTSWSGSPTNRPLTNIQTYNTVSSTWETTGLSTWTTSSTTETLQGNTVNYTKYTYNGSDRSSVQIRLVF